MRNLLAILTMILLFSSCRVHKDITSSKVELESKEDLVRDSTRQVIKALNLKHEIELREAKANSVIFQTDTCPPSIQPISKDCNADSIIKVNKALQNKIRINADGSIEAEGKIQSAHSSVEKAEKEREEIGIRNDSLVRVVQTLSSELKASKAEKQKVITKSSMNLWWLLVAFILGCMLWRYHKQIFSRIKIPFMKSLLFVLLACLLLSSCGHFHDDPTVSVWAEGLWLVPLLLSVGVVLAGISCVKSYKANGKVHPGFAFIAGFCLLILILVIWYVNSGYWK